MALERLGRELFTPTDPNYNTTDIGYYRDDVTNEIVFINNVTGLEVPNSRIGAKGISQYAYFWQEVTDVVGTIAANNDKMLFYHGASSNTAGFASTLPSGDVTISDAGVYEVNWGVSGVEPNAFGLFNGNNLISSTIEGSGAGTQQNKGSAIITVLAGAIISLRTVNCAAAITLALAGTTNVSQNVGTISFKKIG